MMNLYDFNIQFKLIKLYIILSTSTLVNCSDPYCSFGLCGKDEYCCGDDECCVYDKSFYLQLGLLLAVFICILLVGCFYNKCGFLRYISHYICGRWRRNGEQNLLIAKV